MELSHFKNIPDGLDVVNIGSGPSLHDFDWSAVPEINGYNLAVSPEDFRYDARMIRNYGHHLKTGGVVVIVICPLSFAENEYLYRDSFSEKYVGLLPKKDVDLPEWKYMHPSGKTYSYSLCQSSDKENKKSGSTDWKRQV